MLQGKLGVQYLSQEFFNVTISHQGSADLLLVR